MEKKRDSFFLTNKKRKEKPVKDQKQNFNKKEERQSKFDVNRHGMDKEKEEVKEKKPFDKKTYRLKKYSKKYKLEKWEEQRKKKMLHEYKKSIKDDQVPGTYKSKTFDEDVTDSNLDVGKYVKHPDIIEKESQQANKINKDPYSRAKEQYNKVKQDKMAKQEAIKKVKEEKMQKLQEYKKKKLERFKKLSKKTKRGQPVMTGRLELLLEKIQSSK